MVHSEICELLSIRYPLFQGGMAWVSEAVLAAAVSEAGGLGIIAAGNADADYVRAQIRKCKQLTGKPFGVNVMMMSPNVDEVSKVLCEEKVAVVTTGAGFAGKRMDDWMAMGAKVIPVIPSIAIAKRVVRAGAAAVIAEGTESGGHVGELTTMALVPQIADAVDVPVLAAGGIADGRGIAASFMLGARGVQVGTRFLCAEECQIHPNYKDKVLKAREIETVVTGRRLGHPVRTLRNTFSQQLAEAEYNTNITNEQLEEMGVGTLRKAAMLGDVDGGSFCAGQVASMVRKIQPAAEIIEEMFLEAERLLMEANKWVR